ncbi:hypothetical protein EDD85DRAFT_790880 [Armillaria nabsnona]|nr:hypothetical protein EDD85DRAFT_790880 [Armillaria nabsnona]
MYHNATTSTFNSNIKRRKGLTMLEYVMIMVVADEKGNVMGVLFQPTTTTPSPCVADQAMIASVPLELIEHILDELNHHRKSFITALSAYRAFHGRTWFHLPQNLGITNSLALCDISPVVSSFVHSLKIVSSGKEAQRTTLPRYTSGWLDDLWQIDFRAFTSLPLEDIVFPTTMSFRQWLRLCSYPYLKFLIAIEMHNFSAFGAYEALL